MKKIYNITTIIMLTLALTVLASCKVNIEKKGDGTITEKTFTVSDFNSIQFSGATTVHYTVSDTVSIRIKASEELLKRMGVETDANGVLNIYTNESKQIGKNKFSLSFDEYEAEAYISGPSLRRVQVVGSGTFECKDSMTVEAFETEISGSGEINMAAVCTSSFQTKIAGSGEMYIKSVQTDNAAMAIAGSGEIKTGIKGAKECGLSIAGSGEAHIHMTDCGKAHVAIAGSGDVHLAGNVKSLTKEISGSGDIDTKQLTVKE